MRYHATPYQDQSVGTLAEILLRSGQMKADQQARLAEIAANLQLAQGNAAAGRAAGMGQAWGTGLGTIGNLAGMAANYYTKTPTPTVPVGGASGGAGGGAGYGTGLTWTTDPTLGTGRR